jgi:hypothetical protein
VRRGERSRVAGWFVFKPKIQIWGNFGGSCNGRCWYILWKLGPFYGLFLYFMDIAIVRGNLVYFFPVLVFCTKKNLATLERSAQIETNRPFLQRIQ